jgi:hypothetical protein
MTIFSYANYQHLIKTLKQTIPLVDFSDVRADDKQFFILRHDVEFSIQKAYDLAKIEHDFLGIQTSYFFQIRNATYNPFAFQNVKLIQAIHAMGHQVGLHVNSTGLTSLNQFEAFIQRDIALLQNGVDCAVNRFSFHRPTHDLLKLNLQIKGLINTYDHRFFHLDEIEHSNKERPIYYFSDSEHRWKYGDPLLVLNQPIKKVQLLIHPYSWSKEGLDNTQNFKSLIQFKILDMLQSMQNECRHFPSELIRDEKI